ncbi:MAG: thioredoxin [Gemmatimonadota bacterium]|nr:thioredoxin [Gemmatimonadota bacterium]MDH5803938.1 thioredoxin [Gemmatimonadota bacterium]
MAAPFEVTDDNFAEEIEGQEGVAVVDFWATWCGPCQIIAPVIEQIAEDYEGRVKVGKLDVDHNQATAMRFNVRSIPSVLVFKDGKHVDTVIGAVPKAHLLDKVEAHL